MPSWTYNRRVFPDDARIEHALLELETAGYGVFSAAQKGKSLIKYGDLKSLASGTGTIVQSHGAQNAASYPTTNAITHVVTTGTGAASGIEVVIEGHTVVGEGELAAFTFKVQTVTLNGQTPVALTTPLARANRIYNASSISKGTDVISVMVGSSATAGVPAAGTKAIEIPSYAEQSRKCATTISNVDAWIITKIIVGVQATGPQAALADFNVDVRQAGGVFRTQTLVTAARDGGSTVVDVHPAIVVPPNADFHVHATTSATCDVDASVGGYLAIREV